jgi:prolyl oligopeptidase
MVTQQKYKMDIKMVMQKWTPKAAKQASIIGTILVLTSCTAPAPSPVVPTVTAPVAAAVAPAPALPSKPAPPVAPIRAVTETFFGTQVTDNYRYMEDVGKPEVAQFLRGQGDFARTTLNTLPGREALQNRISALSETGVVISGVQLAGNRVFYFKTAPGETSRRLFVRDGYASAERLVFDAASISQTGKRYSIDSYRASPDGQFAAVGVAAGGSEETSLRVVEINASTSRDTGLLIDRVGFADVTAWASDSKSFFYNRLPAQKAGDAKNRYLKSAAYRHFMGRGIETDQLQFGDGLGKFTLDDIDIPAVSMTANGKYMLAEVRHGDARELSLYIAKALSTGTPSWRKVIEPKDKITEIEAANDDIYALSHVNAPRGKILRMGLEQPNLSSAITVVPQGDTVLAQMSLALDGLYVRELYFGVDRLQRLNFSGTSAGKLEFVRLPFDLSIRQMLTDPKKPGALVRLEGWTESPQYMAIEARTGNVSNTGLLTKSNVDFSQISEVRLNVPTKDGASVPLSLMYKRGTLLNSSNPTLLRAYGAYGITMSPTFSATNMAWLERGGILGTCHVRGGGEFGDAWHRGGQMQTKPNTWKDLIACSEFVIQRKFTRSDLLAIAGGSAGGITVGRALTERPDLFAAVVPSVGLMDALRMEFTPNGPPNVKEFGSINNEAGFKGLLAMSTLHQIKDNTNYPAVLFMHGVNDPRVEVWQSAKAAARLQAANKADTPILLRLDYDAGHGIGSTKSQRNAELADIYAFLLWRFGDAAFQPK